jgi:hypothetical protein
LRTGHGSAPLAARKQGVENQLSHTLHSSHNVCWVRRTSDEICFEKDQKRITEFSGIRTEQNQGLYRIQQSRMGHENSESLFDRFFDWDCGWVGVMVVRHRANHLARSSSICLLSADPRYDHRDSDYLASADSNECTAISRK